MISVWKLSQWIVILHIWKFSICIWRSTVNDIQRINILTNSPENSYVHWKAERDSHGHPQRNFKKNITGLSLFKFIYSYYLVLNFIIIFVCAVCSHVCMFKCMMHLCNQKRLLEPQELELQAVVNFPAWVVGTKFGFSGRARSTFNGCANSLASMIIILNRSM